MAENHLKTRIRRMLWSPLGPCKSKDLISADVVEAHRGGSRRHRWSELFFPQPRSSFSYPLLMGDDAVSVTEKIISPSFTRTPPFLLPFDVEGRKCPPSSPIIPFGTPKEKRQPRKKKTRPCSMAYKRCLFSGDEEEGDRAMLMKPPAAEDGVAVVKRSRDPYSDFRASMVEMIVEKQMFGAKDLENLLESFLSLNSRDHHKVIVQAFAEIWEALLL